MVNNKFNKLSVKDVAQLLDISVQTVHFYERKGLIRPIRNQENNFREYTFKDLSKLYYSIKYNRLGFQLNEFLKNDYSYDQTSVSDLKKLLEKRKEQIQMDTAICQYIEDSIYEEETYWKNPTNNLQIFYNLHLYAMSLNICLFNKEYSKEWKTLIPISSMISSWNVQNNRIFIDDTSHVIRKKYFDIISTQVNLSLNTLDDIFISKGIQLTKKIDPASNYEDFFHLQYNELKIKYPSLKDKFYIIPLLTVSHNSINDFTLIKILFEL